MSICIIGGGLAGMALSINLKLAGVQEEVVLVTDAKPSNTRVAGQRYRNRIAREAGDSVTQLENLLASRNGGVVTSAMKCFAALSVSEISRWLHLNPADFNVDLPSLEYEDQESWFGPQMGQPNEWGNARGMALMQWLAAFAAGLGVLTVRGVVTNIVRQDAKITNVTVVTRQADGALSAQTLHADDYVFAGGNPGGSLFQSTNVEIQHTPHELAWLAELKLNDLHLTMFHILGNCDRSGTARVGCFETDALNHATIYLRGPSGEWDLLDEETTALLSQHKAHYHFTEISKKFIRHGGVVRVVFPDQTEKSGRVSHHYSHMGIDTHDGFTVAGMRNLFAVGDAAGTGHWCEHRVRFPGVALANCLVGAALVSDKLSSRSAASQTVRWETASVADAGITAEVPKADKALREINTLGIFDFAFGAEPESGCLAWIEALGKMWERTERSSPLLEISLACAFACYDVSLGKTPASAVGREDLTNRIGMHFNADVSY